MEVRPRTSVMTAKILLLSFALMLIAIFLMNGWLTSSSARVQGERVFENTIPKDVPIKIKIKKEKEQSFKDLKNEKWVGEFELELTNTGDKQIYFIFLNLATDVRVGGERLVFSLVYGRAELGDIISKAASDDIPISPGETHVFKIHPGQVPAWEKGVRDRHYPEATKLRLELESISFGDGTGYFGNHPYPPASRPQSALGDRGRQIHDGPLKAVEWPNEGRSSRTSSTFNTPVSFLPANFLSSESSGHTSVTA